MALAATIACAAPSAEAAFPGKPGRIAFTTSPQGVYGDLFTVDPSLPGGDIRQLTQNSGGPGIADYDACPSWSPSGRLLTFKTIEDPFTPSANRPIPSTSQWLVDPDRGTRRPSPAATSSGCLRFDPNGSLCGNVSPDNSGHTLYYCGDPETGDRREPSMRWEDLTGFEAYAPSSRAHVSTFDGDIRLTTGKRTKRITSTPDAYETDPIFAPDGSAIAWIRADLTNGPLPSGDTGLVEVYALRTGVVRALTPDMDVTDISWEPIPVRCGGRRVTQVGTAGRDVIVGTRKADVLAGLGGDDRIVGGKGKDRLCGGGGRDNLEGGRGKDLVMGGPGRDREKP